MRRSDVKIVNRLGLHARAAAQLVKLAGKFQSKITLIKEDGCTFANAKSILSILTLASSMGTVLTIETEGEDEKDAHLAIEQLFLSGFGESD